VSLVLIVLATAIAYLIGSVPVGVLVCKPLGRDPRTVGSGRTGGTNVYRAAGWPAAILTVAGDVFKGWLALELAFRLGGAADELAGPAAWAVPLAALAVILGHNFSLFSGFRGGAGSTPNLGALLWLDPLATLAVVAVSAAVLFAGRIASVASLTAALLILVIVTFRIVTGLFPATMLLYGLGQLALVTWALRPNIARLREGSERRLDFGRRRAGPEG
jgi:glycerol-3-phosphate acyltransferase PlsY